MDYFLGLWAGDGNTKGMPADSILTLAPGQGRAIATLRKTILKMPQNPNE
jgi:hypothetical protein